MLDPQELRELLANESHAVLVGGQALAVWSELLRITPQANKALTRDLDFLGTSEEAEAFARQVGGTCHIPSMDDQTPNSALVTFRSRSGQLVHVDYLASLAGLNAGAVRRRALEVELTPGFLIKVIHPADLLESRILNMALLPNKRGPVAVEQAVLATNILKAYLRERLASNNEAAVRECLNQVERMFDLANSEHGLRVWLQYGIDPLKAIPESGLPDSFYIRRWPQIRQQIGDKRQRFQKRFAKKVSQDTPNP